MASIGAWISAFRPRTLFLAVGVALAGSGMALQSDQFRWGICVLTVLVAIVLQLLSNLANDYGDFQHGTDITGGRLGPKRALQSGAITPTVMKRAIVIVSICAGVIGLLLLIAAFKLIRIQYFILFIVIGLACIVAAIKYTAGKNPYGYMGLGDFFSFLFFGPVAIVGTFFLHSGHVGSLPWLPSIGFGLLTAVVLNINNMRDIDNDRQSGKKTIPVMIGRKRARVYHFGLIFLSFVCFLMYSALFASHWYHWLYLVVYILLFKLLVDIIKIKKDALLDPYLKYTSLSTFVLALLFCVFINL